VARNWERILLSRLLIAIPEFAADKTFVERLRDNGVIGPWQYDAFRQVAARFKGVKPPTGEPLLQRIAQTIPELLSVPMVDLLHSMGKIDTRNAHALRVLLRAGHRLLPGAVSDDRIYSRLALIFDDVFSSETVAFIRALDNEQIAGLRSILLRIPEERRRLSSEDAALIREMLAKSVARAQIMRSVISTGRMIRGSVAEARSLDNAWDALTLAFDNLLSEKMLRNLVRAGVISPERYALADALRQFSAGAWRKISTARGYESWAARSLLLSEGILGPDTIRLLVALGKITPAQARILYPAATVLRGITRGLGAQWRKNTRYRFVPGEPPIKTFARFSQQTDRGILKLLSQAADDASKEAERLMKTPGFSTKTRAAQQRLVANRIHITMRQMWEDVGSLVIFGEKQAAQAALEAMTFLEQPYGANGADLQRMLRRMAQSGVDSYISREENLRRLSRLVYRNTELAKIMRDYIRPDVPGGSAYAAMRLARTEINNAFHFTGIRYTREMPWVEGYRWNLSGSHGRVDVCNDMAGSNHSGLGRGVYDKGSVPGKPHPQCLCYTTTVTADTRTWYARYRSGAYDSYINRITSDGVFDEDSYTPASNAQVVRSAGTAGLLNVLAEVAGLAAAALRR
jgi:hypothetical protein